MAGWHHWLDGCEFEWTPGVSDRQGGLVFCDSWNRKELDTTERLNWNGLNSLIKYIELLIELKNKTHQYYCLEECHFKCKDTHRLKVKGWKKILHANGNQNKAGVAILILNKIVFKIKTLIIHKEVCCIIIKESVQQEDITFVNI